MSHKSAEPSAGAAVPDAPAWFTSAIERPVESRTVTVADCPIHYLLWPGDSPRAVRRGLLFVHGGAAHANWWRFIAPFFTADYRVCALDLSGMGDSGRRPDYSSDLHVAEMRAVLADAGMGARPIVVGHSFGGFMTMKLAAHHGGELGGAVIVDSPVQSPDDVPLPPPPEPKSNTPKVYADFDAALKRFRLMPEQPCENDFIVDFIGRHSLRRVSGGWSWKFDPLVMGARRFGEPVHEDLQALSCRAALIFGEASALVSRRTARYMSGLMGASAPVVEIPEARHHVMLDQPLAFVAALRMLLESWSRSAPA